MIGPITESIANSKLGHTITSSDVSSWLDGDDVIVGGAVAGEEERSNQRVECGTRRKMAIHVLNETGSNLSSLLKLQNIM